MMCPGSVRPWRVTSRSNGASIGPVLSVCDDSTPDALPDAPSWHPDMPSPTVGRNLWIQRLQQMQTAFTATGAAIFQTLMLGWVLCPGRKTITGIYMMADPGHERAHDAFHRFVRCGAWSAEVLWQTLAQAVVASLAPNGEMEIDLDDTLLHKSGQRVDGAGWWRDAVRSTGTRTVVALGLNLLVVTLRVRPPWGGEPLGLPIYVCLHRKKNTKLSDLAVRALQTVAAWFPERRIRCCADGAYAAPLVPQGTDRITVISRMRRDAALYELAPKATGKRGRPRRKGARLGTPQQIGAKAKRWQAVITDQRGRPKKRLVYSRIVLWYAVSTVPVRLVISRDPDGVEHDDYWVCSDVNLPAQEVVSAYTGRWSIEDTFRATKQHLGIQHPQSWATAAPERAASLGFILYSLVWWWFLGLPDRRHHVTAPPWYANKCNPSFQDALAALRRDLWRNRIIEDSGNEPISAKMIDAMLNALARAA